MYCEELCERKTSEREQLYQLVWAISEYELDGTPGHNILKTGPKIEHTIDQFSKKYCINLSSIAGDNDDIKEKVENKSGEKTNNSSKI